MPTTTKNSPSSSHPAVLVDHEESTESETRSEGRIAQDTALKRPVEPDSPVG